MESRGSALTWWPAPAKLNLFLQVTGRRSDGYHNLSTAFQFLNFGDCLGFGPGEGSAIRLRESNADVEPGSDLVVRAARALQSAADICRGVDVYVDKRIPIGGGLGGGSSDAATTLVALNHLWSTALPADELAKIGVSLGADVPVFVRGHAAYAEGVGEELTPWDFPEPWYVVIDPGVAVSTREVFQAPELTRSSAAATISDFSLGDGRNDCEPVVRARYPEIARALDWLAGHGPARLTGTGGCVFGWYEDLADAENVAAAVEAPWRAIVARGRNRSSLLDALDAGGFERRNAWNRVGK